MSIHRPRSRKVLVLDTASAAGLETVQALGQLRLTVFAGARSDCLAFRSRYATPLLEPETPAELPGWISAQHEQHSFDLIVPSTERALLAFLDSGISASAFDRAVLSPTSSLRSALNKEATRALAAELGLRQPATRLVTVDSARPGQFPVVLKPVASRRIIGGNVEQYTVTLARDRQSWETALRHLDPGIVVQEQEYISGTGLGVEMLFEHGEPRWHFIHERLHEAPLTGGASTYRRSVAATPALLAPAERLLRALSWHGVAMVEFKQTSAGELVLVEINPRLWGSLALGLDAGVNFPAGLLALATHQPLSPQPRYRASYRTRSLANDIAWLKVNFFADHADPLLHTRPRLRSLLELALPLLGRESWDFFSWRDLRPTLATLRGLATTLPAELLRRAHGKLHRRYLAAVAQPRALRRLSRAPKRTLLFLCYGNICRSPLAEAFARTLMPGVTLSSAGFHQRQNRPSPPFMHAVAGRLGTDLVPHRSSLVTRESVDKADLILLMDYRNYALMKQFFPHALQKTLFLGTFGPSRQLEIEDPYDLAYEAGLRIGAEIRDAVSALAHWVEPEQPRTMALQADLALSDVAGRRS